MRGKAWRGIASFFMAPAVPKEVNMMTDKVRAAFSQYVVSRGNILIFRSEEERDLFSALIDAAELDRTVVMIPDNRRGDNPS